MLEPRPFSNDAIHYSRAGTTKNDTSTPASFPMVKGNGTRALRASCNSCSAAKVRCDKHKPTCSRCLGRKECCVYSQSRRSGRRSSRIPSGAKQLPISPSSSRSKLSSNVADSQSHRLGSQSRPVSFTPESTTGHFDPYQYSILPARDDTGLFDRMYLSTERNECFDLTDLRGHSFFDASLSSSPDSPNVYTPGSMQTSPTGCPCSPNEGLQALPTLPETIDPGLGPPKDEKCDCISRLLASSANSDLSSQSAVDTVEVCTSVLQCQCLCYDERAISLLALAILHNLSQASLKSAMVEFLPELALVRQLEMRLRASQPVFARAGNNVFVQFWLATSGCAGF